MLIKTTQNYGGAIKPDLANVENSYLDKVFFGGDIMKISENKIA